MSGRRALGEGSAWALLGRAHEVRVAGVSDGRPWIRTMSSAVADGAIWLHGVPGGTVADASGGRVQIEAHEIVARIPSYLRDARRACPATTYYRSVLADGALEVVNDPKVRAAALQALMEARQPEGGHVPITADDPLYAATVRGVGLWRVAPDALSGVEKLGQDQTAGHIEGVLRGLWRRGQPEDLEAIEVISGNHPERPAFADVKTGLRPRCFPSDGDVARAVALVAGRYWNEDQSEVQLAEALRCSTAWVGLEDDGVLVATARAISDRSKRSWVYDVAVDDVRQRGGIGTTLLELLLAHPAVRGTEVNLATRDAMGFYRRLGFVEVTRFDRGSYVTTVMRRPRVG